MQTITGTIANVFIADTDASEFGGADVEGYICGGLMLNENGTYDVVVIELESDIAYIIPNSNELYADDAVVAIEPL